MEEHDCEKHDTRERFDAVLKEFLSERVEAERGGWAPVTQETQGQLSELIHLLILLKWEEDCDGDLPVRYKLWDRTSDMQDTFRQFTIKSDFQKSGGLIRWLGLLATNVKMAADTFDREVRCLEYRKLTIEVGEEDE
jgi:hypothetical protein